MNHHHIARLNRSLIHPPSRRDVLRGLASFGLSLGAYRLQAAAGKNKHHKQRKKKKAQTPSLSPPTCTPRCGRKVCGDDGCGGSCGSCAAEQFCRSGTCCTPEPPDVTCVGRCGTVPDNICHLPASCTCPGNQQCLSNGSCAIVCVGVGNECPPAPGCVCQTSADGPKHCSDIARCDLYKQVCASTADCPPRQQCQVSTCGAGGSTENRCVPLCIG